MEFLGADKHTECDRDGAQRMWYFISAFRLDHIATHSVFRMKMRFNEGKKRSSAASHAIIYDVMCPHLYK